MDTPWAGRLTVHDSRDQTQMHKRKRSTDASLSLSLSLSREKLRHARIRPELPKDSGLNYK